MEKELPTLEEFNNAILEDLKKSLIHLSDQEVEKYVMSEKSQKLIKNRYNECIDEYNSNKITYDQILGASVWSASNCLDLMYSPCE